MFAFLPSLYSDQTNHMMNDPHQQQQFCLRWNNHSSTLVSVFEHLYTNQSLVDVTLFTDGRLLRAHKVVLSACSPYFQTLFAQAIDKHPIVILKDVKHDHLKALLEYMYKGEVNISQDQLGPLIKAAESLKIKGLADGGSKEDVDARSSVPYPIIPPRPSKSIEHPVQVTPSPAPSLDIKPRLPPAPYPSTTSSDNASSVLSTALTIPPALSLSAPLNLPPLSILPPTLASTLASSLSTTISQSMPSHFPLPHERPSRLSECETPRAKKRKKPRRHSGECVESPESDCPSSGSPAESIPNLHLPRIPATITPISHPQSQPHHHLEQPQQHPKDLSSHSSQNSHSHANHHESERSQHFHPHSVNNIPPFLHHPAAAASPIPLTPPAAHAPPTLTLPTPQHSLHKTQSYPEDLKNHSSSRQPQHHEPQHNSHHANATYNLSKPSKPPLGIPSRDASEERSPSPPFERNCSSRGSKRDEEPIRTQPVKGSPPSKSGSDPESSSTTKGSLPPGKVEDTSSDNHYSDDDGDDISNDRYNERPSDYSMGPSTSRPHSEETILNQNYLSWPVYQPETSSADESNLAENSNQDYLRAINLVRAGFSGLLPGSMTPELLSRPAPMGLPRLLQRSNYPFPETPKQFSCEKCGRTYASTGNLKRHKKYECGVEPQFSCPICKKKFQHRHSVKIHVFSTHRNEGGEGGQGDPAREAAGLFSSADGVATVATGHLREEYFPMPQEASTAQVQNQDAII